MYVSLTLVYVLTLEASMQMYLYVYVTSWYCIFDTKVCDTYLF